jgi:hypothetical protein
MVSRVVVRTCGLCAGDVSSEEREGVVGRCGVGDWGWKKGWDGDGKEVV